MVKLHTRLGRDHVGDALWSVPWRHCLQGLTRPGKADVTQSASVSVPGEAPVTAIAALPTGFEVSDVALSGGQILFYGAVAGGDRKAIVFDIAAGRIVADVSVKTN
jgi:hypothetical protein